ncbi:MAG TPA: hypothetical protein VIL55_16820 [Naasia sp.]|jgi:hypothetical protein
MHRKTAGRDIEVVALTSHEWRICDGTIDERDARRVLGYIEERPDSYEVLALCPAPRVQGEYSSWDDALKALLATSGRTLPAAG